MIEGDYRPRPFEAPFDSGGGIPQSSREPYGTDRIVETASHFGIDLARVEEPIVREYLGVHNAYTDLQEAIRNAEEQLDHDANLTAGVRELFQTNYRHSLGFIAAIHLKVEEQLGVRAIASSEIKEALDPAIADMGLSIAYGEDTIHPDYYQRTSTHDIAYYEAQQERRNSVLQQDENLNYIPLATKMPENYLSNQTYAQILNQASQTRIDITKIEEAYPPEPGDDYSHETEQVIFINELHQLMDESLKEWVIYHKANHPSHFRSLLNAFLEPYDLRVDVQPLKD